MSNARRGSVLRSLRTAGALFLVALAGAADSSVGRWECGPVAPPAASAETGRLLILPGVGNTSFHLAGFVASAERQLPGFDVDVRTWGVPFLTIHNLRAHARNIATAQQIATEIAHWRSAHPRDKFYLVGYSGGGGMAVLIASALPAGVVIDRLILVAPAISPDYPLATQVIPHVRELVASFASDRDLQVGWGTRTFGTIDRKSTASAGAVGFATAHDRLLEHRWSPAEQAFGHFGNHLSYLSQRWQAARLLPVLDPQATPDDIRRSWSRTCEES